MCSSARGRKYIGLRHETGEDSKIKFTIEPLPGDDAFNQWKDGMKAVAGLPMGIPADFRKKVWLSLADNYLHGLCIDWEKTVSLAFNRKSNPDDNKLELQIAKDLHRTGSSMFSGEDSDEDRAMLERILLAYARWNKQVGYCQGFNVIAAIILDVMDRQEDCALKVMIFLIDRVLPEGYFANSLRALSVDMAVFRDLLRLHLPRFSRHLEWLQAATRDQSTGACYEPPLTNVFTMQWFLTLFATCLPKTTALRVWDAVLLEGSEILLRTAIAVWGMLQRRLCTVQSADEFYTTMGTLTREMLDGQIIGDDELIEKVYEMGPFPMPGLAELRDKYTQIASAISRSRSSRQPSDGLPGTGPEVESFVGDDLMDITCFAGMFPPSPQREFNRMGSASPSNPSDILASKLPSLPLTMQTPLEMMAHDVDMLDRQYQRLLERQKQAHIILAVARQQQASSQTESSASMGVSPLDQQSTAVNHLFVGRELVNRSRNSAASATSGTSKSPSVSPSARRSPAELKFPAAAAVKEEIEASRNVTDINRHNSGLQSISSIDSGLIPKDASVMESCSANETGKILNDVNAGRLNTSISMPIIAKNLTSARPDARSKSDVDVLRTSALQTGNSTRNSNGNTGSSSRSQQEGLADFSCQKSRSVSDFHSMGSRIQTLEDTGGHIAKVFNPFPKQYVNKRRTKNGIKLGLYSADDVILPADGQH